MTLLLVTRETDSKYPDLAGFPNGVYPVVTLAEQVPAAAVPDRPVMDGVAARLLADHGCIAIEPYAVFEHQTAEQNERVWVLEVRAIHDPSLPDRGHGPCSDCTDLGAGRILWGALSGDRIEASPPARSSWWRRALAMARR